MQRDLITTADQSNAEHLAAHPGYSELRARIAGYELAFQLQTTAPRPSTSLPRPPPPKSYTA
jgi:hypothetical protein